MFVVRQIAFSTIHAGSSYCMSFWQFAFVFFYISGKFFRWAYLSSSHTPVVLLLSVTSLELFFAFYTRVSLLCYGAPESFVFKAREEISALLSSFVLFSGASCGLQALLRCSYCSQAVFSFVPMIAPSLQFGNSRIPFVCCVFSYHIFSGF